MLVPVQMLGERESMPLWNGPLVQGGILRSSEGSAVVSQLKEDKTSTLHASKNAYADIAEKGWSKRESGKSLIYKFGVGNFISTKAKLSGKSVQLSGESFKFRACSKNKDYSSM